MKNIYFKFILGCCALFTLVQCTNELEPDSQIESAEHENFSEVRNSYYIVTLHKGTINIPGIQQGKMAYDKSKSDARQQIKKDFSYISDENIENVFVYALEGFVAKLDPASLAQLKKDTRVKRIEEDYLISLGKPTKPGGGGGSLTQTTPWGIIRVGGGNNTSAHTAWIIDSGIDLDHPDLNVNTSLSQSFVTSGNESNSADDANGHGTHVAGTVAAKNNTIGVVGVSPGSSLVALKVLTRRGTGSFSWTVAALDYVFANAGVGDAVNMSLGPKTPYIDSAVDDAVIAVANKGVKIAIAAGNSGDDASLYSPAHVNHPNVYTVSAVNNNDVFASFSNYGSPVDFAAPGVSINSTWKGGGYNTISGTSMACPHVCGLLLLGNINTNGYAINDPDGNADPIAHH